MEKEITIPQGSTPEDIKVRKKIISDFYAKWIAAHPDKKIWNKSLRAYIHVKFLSINETKGHASGTYESNKAVLGLTELLEKATLVNEKTKKQDDNNQKAFSKILVMMHRNIKLTVGYQPSKRHYVQYCVTVPGTRMHKK